MFVHDGRRTYPGDVFFSSNGLLPRGAAVPADGIRAGGEIVPGRELLPREALFDGGEFEPDPRLIRKSVAGAGIDLEGREAPWIAAVPAGTGARAETPVRPLVVLLDRR